uniref:Uncharacterized protein n=1 Tax=Anguilla anguilla TaxID=7936 RepID=A0A0E9RFZ5_ANGAN
MLDMLPEFHFSTSGAPGLFIAHRSTLFKFKEKKKGFYASGA